jgi:diadenosine tetraphosphate (Ap4A) HIT family hydrolase
MQYLKNYPYKIKKSYPLLILLSSTHLTYFEKWRITRKRLYGANVYNKENIFYKILKSEIPAKVIYENDTVLSFYDIRPVCKIHALVITKGLYSNFDNFTASASVQEVKDFFSSVSRIADILNISQTGYRMISNIGSDSRQEIEHFHVHILGGERL